MSVKVVCLKCRVRVKSAKGDKTDRARPVKPSLDFAMPEPIAPQPRIDEATDGAAEGFEVDAALAKADPRKVADRVYELMQREKADARSRGGARRMR